MAKDLNGHAGGNGKPGRKRDCDQLLELVLKQLDWDLWHWEDEAYVSFDVNGHRETHKLSSSPVKRRLRHQFRNHTGRAPSCAAVTDAIAMLEAEAFATSWERPIHLRVASYEGVLFIDLGDQSWRIIRVDMHGWKVIEAADAPVVFLRSKGMRALPEPRSGGRFDTLLKYINVAPEEMILVYVWIIAAFCLSGPYPLLVLIAEQGSGKSTLVRALRRLIDPNKSPFQSLPKDEEGLMISAKNRWLIALDNMSNIQPWLSDALCRLSTGGGLNKRKLYTDDDEVIFDVQRPVILNGIADLASRPDLADRALVLRLPGILEHQRRSESEFWAAFEHDLPYILGAVFDVLSGVLDHIDDIQLDRAPRMADFARIGVAAEPDLPVESGSFMRAYWDNQTGLTKAALENDLFIAEVAAFAREDGPWEGTATQLRDAILNRWGEDQPCDDVIPSSPNAVSSRLRRFLPALRAEGVEVVLDHREPGSGRRLIRIRALKRG
jgi:hypothetical protein